MSDDIKELVRGRELRATLAERDDLMRRLRGQHRAIRSGYLKGLFLAAADALEAMAEQRDRFVERFNEARLALQAAEAERDRLSGEVERLKSQRDEYLQFWKNNAEACEAAEAERDRMKAVGQKLLAKFDHPTASVTQWDVDELRKALGGDE